jgi:vitamin K-dependent gamma-carboxylase
MASTTLAPPLAPAAPQTWEARIARALFAPVDIGMLVFFRVAFGLIMVVEAWRYLSAGWVLRSYLDPDFHFTFYGFSWVRPWPGDGMTYAFYAMGLLGACIAAGFLYRLATALFFLNFAHIFLCDQTYYLNHFYLLTLISLMMCFLPANRAWSVDALLWPKIASPTVPVWTLRLIQFHVAVAYFYGGIAKLNADWFQGEPMRSALSARPEFPLIGQWFGEEWMIWAFVWGGVLFDLLIVPALIWPRTRMAAFIAALGFHLTNSILFDIGIFPWFMVAGTILFFPPDWLKVEEGAKGSGGEGAKGKARRRAPVVEAATPVAAVMPSTLSRRQKLLAGVLAAYVVLHLVVPFRHLLYPGDVSWTEEGHLYAWHMKLRRKSGSAWFFAVTADGRRLPESTLLKHASEEQLEKVERRRKLWDRERVFLKDEQLYLSPRQRKKMSGRPDMILQYAHFLAGEFQKHGYGDVAIHCESAVSLNGRPFQPIVDPAVNLATVEPSLGPASWIVPLEHPLPKPGEKAAAGDGDDVEGAIPGM